MRVVWCGVSVLLGVLLSASAWAQGSGEEVLTLVRVGQGGGALESWWVSGGERSGFEEGLVDGWGVGMVGWDASKVSRVYKRARLGEVNARSLGGLLGARWVVLGEVRVEGLESVGLGWEGWKVSGWVVVLGDAKGRGEVREEFRVEREVWRRGREDGGVLRGVGEELGGVVRAMLKGPVVGDEVGVSVVLEGVESEKVLRDVLAGMRRVGGVKGVGVGWLGAGRVGVRVGGEDNVERVVAGILGDRSLWPEGYVLRRGGVQGKGSVRVVFEKVKE